MNVASDENAASLLVGGRAASTLGLTSREGAATLSVTTEDAAQTAGFDLGVTTGATPEGYGLATAGGDLTLTPKTAASSGTIELTPGAAGKLSVSAGLLEAVPGEVMMTGSPGSGGRVTVGGDLVVAGSMQVLTTETPPPPPTTTTTHSHSPKTGRRPDL
jgi:hypothetical protein